MNLDHPALQAEQSRRAAMIANDAEALGALMAPGLVYAHSTGGRDSRDSYLENIRNGSLRYLAVSLGDLQVHPLPEHSAAVVTGRMEAAVHRHGQNMEVNSHFMTVWACDADQRWRLHAHQGTAAR